VPGVNTPDEEFGARLSPSGDELYLTRPDGANVKHFFRFTKDAQGKWANGAAVPELDVRSTDMPVVLFEINVRSITFVGEAIAYFSAFRGRPWRLYKVTRTNGTWSRPTEVPVGTELSVEYPWHGSTTNGLYFMKSPTPYQLYYAALSSLTTASRFTPQGSVSQAEYAPTLTADEKTMYYADSSSGELKIYRATRSSPNVAFGQAVAVQELNRLGSDDQPSWISPDGCAIYFTSNRSGGAGSFDIYRARKPQ
jgi:WD40-like Beta Propeller Repeat